LKNEYFSRPSATQEHDDRFPPAKKSKGKTSKNSANPWHVLYLLDERPKSYKGELAKDLHDSIVSQQVARNHTNDEIFG
jgi:hypothetical protein